MPAAPTLGLKPWRQALLDWLAGSVRASDGLPEPLAAGKHDIREWGTISNGVDCTSLINQAVVDIDGLNTLGILRMPNLGFPYQVDGQVDMFDRMNVLIQGDGGFHDMYAVHGGSPAPNYGTLWKRTGVSSLPVIRMGSTSGASVLQVRQGIRGVNIDGGNVASECVLWDSLWGGLIDDCMLRNPATTGYGFRTTTHDIPGGTDDTQACQIGFITIRVAGGGATGALFGSGAAGIGNTSFCTMYALFVAQGTGPGIVFADSDSNEIGLINVNRAPGAGAYGVEFWGRVGAGSSGHARGNVVRFMAPGPGGSISRGAESGHTQPAVYNRILCYSIENAAPEPVIETDSQLSYVTDRGVDHTASGEDPFGHGFACSSSIFTSSGAQGLFANVAVWQKLISGGKCAKLAIHVGTASGNIDVGIYDNTGTLHNQVPNNKKTSSGSVACPAAGYAEITLSSTYTAKKGDWVAIAADNGTITVHCGYQFGNSQTSAGTICAKATSFPLPATATSTTPGYFRNPIVVGRAS